MTSDTLSRRFLLVVLLVVLLPMLLVGAWLTRSAARSGRGLLRAQLEASADAIQQSVSRQWSTRGGELRLLASNSAAVRLLGSNAPPVDADTLYLTTLTRSLSGSVVGVTYESVRSGLRWATRADTARTPPSQGVGRDVFGASTGVVPITLAVRGNQGDIVGEMHATLRLNALLPTTDVSVRRSIGSAFLTFADSAGIVWSEVADSVNLLSATVASSWETVSRPLPVPGLRVIVAAPSRAYVEPFESAAKVGTTVLLLAALLALAITAAISRKLVSSLAGLADAADEVAAGNLHRTVEITGTEEVRRLSRTFNAMTQSLRQSLTELSSQRSLAAVGEFAAGLSHDVRNSLTAVRVDLQHATWHLDAQSEAAPLVGRALESVQRLDATVSSALRIARPEDSGTLVSIDTPLQRAADASLPIFTERGALLRVPTWPLLFVRGNAGALEQLFLNVLLNAAEASAAGSETRVDVRIEESSVVVCVTDTGEGIPEDQLSLVGTPFYTTKPLGTGLGVSLASRIAQAHGGSLAIASMYGRGTSVTIVLPVQSS